jgi:hypothetical protein
MSFLNFQKTNGVFCLLIVLLGLNLLARCIIVLIGGIECIIIPFYVEQLDTKYIIYVL